MRYITINNLFLTANFKTLRKEPTEDDMFDLYFYPDDSFSISNKRGDFFNDYLGKPLKFTFYKDTFYYYPSFLTKKQKYFASRKDNEFFFSLEPNATVSFIQPTLIFYFFDSECDQVTETVTHYALHLIIKLPLDNIKYSCIDVKNSIIDKYFSSSKNDINAYLKIIKDKIKYDYKIIFYGHGYGGEIVNKIAEKVDCNLENIENVSFATFGTNYIIKCNQKFNHKQYIFINDSTVKIKKPSKSDPRFTYLNEELKDQILIDPTNDVIWIKSFLVSSKTYEEKIQKYNKKFNFCLNPLPTEISKELYKDLMFMLGTCHSIDIKELHLYAIFDPIFEEEIRRIFNSLHQNYSK